MAELTALTPPTLEDIKSRLDASLVARIPDIDPLTYSRMSVLHATLAGALVSMYSFGLKIDDQLFPDTADFEHLLRSGEWRGYSLQPAKYASGVIVVGAINSSSGQLNLDQQGHLKADGSVTSGSAAQIPRGTIFVATGSGLEFESKADATENGGLILVSIVAKAIGSASNLAKNTELKLKTPIKYSHDKTLEKGLVKEDLTGGAEVESLEHLRSRILNRTATQVEYGKKGDFVKWAIEKDSSITGAWEFPNVDDIGTLQISIATGDDDKSSENNPPSGIVKKVFDHIQTKSPTFLLGGERPDGTKTPAMYKVIALKPKYFAVRVAIKPDNKTLKDSIVSELNEFINTTSPGQTLTTIQIKQVIENTPGLTHTAKLKYLYPVTASQDLSLATPKDPEDVVIGKGDALRFKGIHFVGF